MTEKIARRGVRVPTEYGADFLAQVSVGTVASQHVTVLKADDTLQQVRAWMNTHAPEAQHQGYPVVDAQGLLIGVVTRRDLLAIPEEAQAQPEARRVRDLIARAPVVIFEDASLREASDQMVRQRVGRLPVVTRAEPTRVIGILTRSDLLQAHSRRLEEHHHRARHIRVRQLRPIASVLPGEETIR